MMLVMSRAFTGANQGNIDRKLSSDVADFGCLWGWVNTLKKGDL